MDVDAILHGKPDESPAIILAAVGWSIYALAVAVLWTQRKKRFRFDAVCGYTALGLLFCVPLTLGFGLLEFFGRRTPDASTGQTLLSILWFSISFMLMVFTTALVRFLGEAAQPSTNPESS